MPKHYQPNLESISKHTVPQGIMTANSVFSFIGGSTLSLHLHSLPDGLEPSLLMSDGLLIIHMQSGIVTAYVAVLVPPMSII